MKLQLHLSTIRLEYHELQEKNNKDSAYLHKIAAKITKAEADLKQLINDRSTNTRR